MVRKAPVKSMWMEGATWQSLRKDERGNIADGILNSFKRYNLNPDGTRKAECEHEWRIDTWFSGKTKEIKKSCVKCGLIERDNS